MRGIELMNTKPHSMLFIRIGMDNIDSYWGGCTTHFGYIVIKKIISLKGSIVDYPKLIRLNPDIPWKTRGNGSVCIDALIPRRYLNPFLQWLNDKMIEYLDITRGFSIKIQPAVVVMNGDLLDRQDYEMLEGLYKKSLTKIVRIKEAEDVLKALDEKILAVYTPSGKRGLIGALSSMGNMLVNDYTYELLIYRDINIRGRERFKAPKTEIIRLLIEDEHTFAHVDMEKEKILISPGGPDPVIAGIRGNKLSKIMKLFRRIRNYLDYDGWVIYVTNQGTHENLQMAKSGDTNYYRQTFIGLKMNRKVRTYGGHLFVYGYSNSNQVMVNFYYESGRMRSLIDSIPIRNISIWVGGGIKPNKLSDTPNIVVNPQLVIIENNVANIWVKAKPICPHCKIALTSAGTEHGYKCKKCNYNIPKLDLMINKTISLPHIIMPPYRSILHISKPLKRMGREKKVRFLGIKNPNFIQLG